MCCSPQLFESGKNVGLVRPVGSAVLQSSRELFVFSHRWHILLENNDRLVAPHHLSHTTTHCQSQQARLLLKNSSSSFIREKLRRHGPLSKSPRSLALFSLSLSLSLWTYQVESHQCVQWS